MNQSVLVSRQKVPVTFDEKILEVEKESIMDDSKIKNYINGMSNEISQKEFDINGIKIDFQRKAGSKTLFYGTTVNITRKPDNKFVPGISLLRGNSACLLLILISRTDPNKKWVVLKKEFRPAVSRELKKEWLTELPACIIFENQMSNTNFIKSVCDELNLKIKDEKFPKFTDLTNVFLKDPHMIPSSGGCDEKIKIFSASFYVNDEDVKIFEESETEKYTSDKNMSIKIKKLDEGGFIDHPVNDMKIFSSLILYKNYLRKIGEVPILNKK